MIRGRSPRASCSAQRAALPASTIDSTTSRGIKDAASASILTIRAAGDLDERLGHPDADGVEIVPVRVLRQHAGRHAPTHDGEGGFVIIRDAGLNAQADVHGTGRIDGLRHARLDLLHVELERARVQRVGDQDTIRHLAGQLGHLGAVRGEVDRHPLLLA